MKRLMKAELYKFQHEKSVWAISGVLIACACISIFTKVYSCAEDTFVNLGKDVMVLYLACAIYAGVSLADEFTNRTVFHIIACGYSRLQFLLAKVIHYLFGCLLIVISYLIVSTVIATAALGIRASALALIKHMVCSLLGGLPFYFAMAMIFFLFAIITRKGSLAIAGSVSFSILFVVFTNKAYFAQVFPEQSWLRLLPTMQLSMIYNGEFILGDYLIALLLSLCAVVVIFFSCVILIDKVAL